MAEGYAPPPFYTGLGGRPWFDVTRYGATGNGTTDDTAAIQAAVTAASAAGGGVVLIPKGNYKVTGTITITKGIQLLGAGWTSVLVVAASVDASTDIIKISPASASDEAISDYVLENFRITPASGTPGRHAIAIDITTYPVFNSIFRKLRLDGLGGKGIVTLPNASPLTDGFFCSTIEECVIYNGVYLDKAGDSVRVLRCTLLGANVGVYADLVTGSAGGAHGLDIISCNITSNGGAVLVKNAWAGRLMNCNIECPTPSGLANNALVDIDGVDAANLTNNFVIAFNLIAALPNYDLVRCNFTRRTQIFANFMGEPGGTGVCYKVTANATDTNILFDCSSSDSSSASEISDAGVRTSFVRHFTRMEFTSSLWLRGSALQYCASDTAGNRKAILALSTADNTCAVGCIDAPATNGHLLLYANGAEKARITPGGEFLVGTSSPEAGTYKAKIAGDLALPSITAGTTVGAAGGADALPATPLGYISVKINGAVVKIPYYNT